MTPPSRQPLRAKEHFSAQKVQESNCKNVPSGPEIQGLEARPPQASLAGMKTAKNAPFPPLAETLTVQPCQAVAEKVSLVPLVCSVLEAVGQSRHPLHANGTSPGNGEEREPSN